MRGSPHKRRTRRSVGIALSELAEDSRFGAHARRELIRWFPSAGWVKKLAADPKLRELAMIDRRSFLVAVGLVPAAALVPGCPVGEAARLLFLAIQIAQQVYGLGEGSGGSALFSNSSQSRESFQLLTSLFNGSPVKPFDLQDERDYEVNVPAMSKDWVHSFEELFSMEAGDHYVSGQALGETRNTDVFRYEE